MASNSSDPPASIEMAYALMTLGMLDGSALPAVAERALGEELDSEHLRLLAGLDATDPQPAREYFARALIELGYELLDKTRAVDLIVRMVSEEIVTDSKRAVEGARLIWKATVSGGREGHEYDSFVYAASEWEDRPADRSRLEKAIVEEAKRWVRS